MKGDSRAEIQGRGSQLVSAIRAIDGDVGTVGETKLDKKMVVTAGLCTKRSPPSVGVVTRGRRAAVGASLCAAKHPLAFDKSAACTLRARAAWDFAGGVEIGTSLTTWSTGARGISVVGAGTVGDFPSGAEATIAVEARVPVIVFAGAGTTAV